MEVSGTFSMGFGMQNIIFCTLFWMILVVSMQTNQFKTLGTWSAKCLDFQVHADEDKIKLKKRKSE